MDKEVQLTIREGHELTSIVSQEKLINQFASVLYSNQDLLCEKDYTKVLQILKHMESVLQKHYDELMDSLKINPNDYNEHKISIDSETNKLIILKEEQK